MYQDYYLDSRFRKSSFSAQIFPHLNIWVVRYCKYFLHLFHLVTIKSCSSSFSGVKVVIVWNGQLKNYRLFNLKNILLQLYSAKRERERSTVNCSTHTFQCFQTTSARHDFCMISTCLTYLR